MKNIFLLLFLLMPVYIFSQTGSLLTPIQMKEDVDFYFKTLYDNHPNPYYYYSIEEFENKKNSIYSRLNKPMSWADFAYIISEINAYVDSHSTIAPMSFSSLTKATSIADTLIYMPNVKIKQGKLYLKENGREIKEINGLKATEMIQFVEKYINKKLPYESNCAQMEKLFCPIVMGKFDNIRSPYIIKFTDSRELKSYVGYSLKEYYENSIYNPFRGREVSYFKIYPFSSIAIFTIPTFQKDRENDYQKIFEVFLREINDWGIKYVFYDLTQNGGGQFSTLWTFGMNTLNVINHNDIYFKLTETKRTEHVNNKYKIEKLVSQSNKADDVPEDRKLFVIQSANTKSCADYYCRIVAENKLGILVGQNTGEPTVAFTYTNDYIAMPNSGICFQVATALYDFSDYFNTETLHPDLYWDVNNNQEFTEEELTKIVNICNDKKTKL